MCFSWPTLWQPTAVQGGSGRDPLSPYDCYDVNHDGAIGVLDDILVVAFQSGH